MSTDRELLELAAKAAGVPIVSCTCGNARWPFKHDEAKSGKYGHWNPLTDDGDCARMEAAIGINLEWYRSSVTAYLKELGGVNIQYSSHGGDRNAARRSASLQVIAKAKATP